MDIKVIEGPQDRMYRTMGSFGDDQMGIDTGKKESKGMRSRRILKGIVNISLKIH